MQYIQVNLLNTIVDDPMRSVDRAVDTAIIRIDAITVVLSAGESRCDVHVGSVTYVLDESYTDFIDRAHLLPSR